MQCLQDKCVQRRNSCDEGQRHVVQADCRCGASFHWSKQLGPDGVRPGPSTLDAALGYLEWVRRPEQGGRRAVVPNATAARGQRVAPFPMEPARDGIPFMATMGALHLRERQRHAFEVALTAPRRNATGGDYIASRRVDLCRTRRGRVNLNLGPRRFTLHVHSTALAGNVRAERRELDARWTTDTSESMQERT